MAVPVKVMPNDEAILPGAGSDLDGWARRFWLDPLKDWSGSAITADLPFLIDSTHKADEAPYFIAYLTPADMLTNGAGVVQMKVKEDTLLRRTFVEQQVTLVAR